MLKLAKTLTATKITTMQHMFHSPVYFFSTLEKPGQFLISPTANLTHCTQPTQTPTPSATIATSSDPSASSLL